MRGETLQVDNANRWTGRDYMDTAEKLSAMTISSVFVTRCLAHIASAGLIMSPISSLVITRVTYDTGEMSSITPSSSFSVSPPLPPPLPPSLTPSSSSPLSPAPSPCPLTISFPTWNCPAHWQLQLVISHQ